MNAYVYNAALYCEPCGEAIKRTKDAALEPDTGDSDDYPQGPHSDGGGEADCPQHCDACGAFLENPLTRDGEDYVREAVAVNEKAACAQLGQGPAEWRAFYSYLFN